MDTTIKSSAFPLWIVLLTNLFSLSVYFLGFMIMLELGWVVAGLYLAYILFLEYRLLSKHCTNCYYWNKTCAFGKGKLSALFFKKGENSRFREKEMTMKDLIPDLAVSLIPIITGIVLLFIRFDLRLSSLMIMLIVFSTLGNGIVRGNLSCNFCKQKELGCPAEKFFKKDES
jgi:hypothetical protein